MRPRAALVCLLLLGCSPRKPSAPTSTPTPRPTPTPTAMKAELEAPTTVVFDNNGTGKRLLEVAGGKVQVQPGAQPLGITGTRATLYQNGAPALTVAARRVHYDATSKTLVAEGAIDALRNGTPEPERIQCDTLTWQPGTNLLIGDGRVAITKGTGYQLFGSHLTADIKLQKLHLTP